MKLLTTGENFILVWICFSQTVCVAIASKYNSRNALLKQNPDDKINGTSHNYSPTEFPTKSNTDNSKSHIKNIKGDEYTSLPSKRYRTKRRATKKRTDVSEKLNRRHMSRGDANKKQRNVRETEEDSTKGYCILDQLMVYLARLQIINPESIVNLVSESDLEALCKSVKTSLTDTDTYLTSCTLHEQQNLYMNLIDGVRELYKKICDDQEFKKVFLEHSNCITKLRSEYEGCTGPHDWVENPDPKDVCKAYSDIVKCYFNKTSSECGNDAAEVMNTLMRQVVDSVITVDCSNSSNVSQELPQELVKSTSKSYSPGSICFAMSAALIFGYIMT